MFLLLIKTNVGDRVKWQSFEKSTNENTIDIYKTVVSVIKMQRVSARLQSIGRSLSERSALSPSNDDNSYGSFLLTFGGLRQTLRRSTSYQVIRD